MEINELAPILRCCGYDVTQYECNLNDIWIEKNWHLTNFVLNHLLGVDVYYYNDLNSYHTNDLDIHDIKLIMETKSSRVRIHKNGDEYNIIYFIYECDYDTIFKEFKKWKLEK